MPNLVVDIGNTRIKSALFEKAELVWKGIFDEIEEALDSWSDNAYLGGAISPGLAMRAKAMNSLTARLPLVGLKEKPKKRIGDNTISCMQIGIWYGVEYELSGQIQSYQQDYPEIKIFVCGGDAQSFVSLAKGHIFVIPNLVLHGLNCILNHNVE